MQTLSAALGEPVSVVGPLSEARGRASHCIEIRTPTRHLVVKRSDAADEVVREAAFYRVLAPQLPLSLPRLHYADEGQIVLDYINGEPGRAEVGCPPDAIDGIAAAIGALHRAFTGQRPDVPLQRWSLSPQASAALVRERLPDFRRAVPCSPIHDRLDDLPEVVAVAIDRLDALEHTVIHADLHLENLIFTADGPFILDWQTVSWGPPAVDVARFLVEGTGPSPDFARLAGAPPGIADALDALLATIVCSRWFRQPLDSGTLELVLRDLATWVEVRSAVAHEMSALSGV